MDKEFKKAGGFTGAGALAGAVIGKWGSIGIAGLGTAIGAPWFLAGAVVGLAGYGLYKACESGFKEDSEKSQGNKKEVKKNELSPVKWE